jgi:hypothetical protein
VFNESVYYDSDAPTRLHSFTDPSYAYHQPHGPYAHLPAGVYPPPMMGGYHNPMMGGYAPMTHMVPGNHYAMHMMGGYPNPMTGHYYPGGMLPQQSSMPPMQMPAVYDNMTSSVAVTDEDYLAVANPDPKEVAANRWRRLSLLSKVCAEFSAGANPARIEARRLDEDSFDPAQIPTDSAAGSSSSSKSNCPTSDDDQPQKKPRLTSY